MISSVPSPAFIGLSGVPQLSVFRIAVAEGARRSGAGMIAALARKAATLLLVVAGGLAAFWWIVP